MAIASTVAATVLGVVGLLILVVSMAIFTRLERARADRTMKDRTKGERPPMPVGWPIAPGTPTPGYRGERQGK